jgi:hypothetical protein
MSVVEKTKTKYITAIDPMELAVRLAESYNGLKRPPGWTTSQAFFSMEAQSQNAWLRSANAAMDYWRERINDLKQPS